jgi:4-hydroxy-3-polyprenylbenzoate decarboxylase
MLPVPTWTPGKDAGPYITAPVITKHGGTGAQNVGIYRTQVLGRDRLTVNFSPGRQGTANAKTFLDAGKPAPVAWVIGPDPAIYLAAVGNLPYGVDELRFAGGLQAAPIELVPAQTVDLLVPANAEIVIEGEVYPGELADEGPFGEFAGFMSAPNPRPVVRVTAITHRGDPVYWGLSSQMPPSESTTLQSAINAGILLKTLRDDLGESSVVDAFIDHTFGGLLGHGIFALRQGPPGNGKRLGRLIASISYLKRITLVDADIDIRDPVHLEWALNSCYDPARDTVIIDDVFVPAGMDPSVPERSRGSKLVLDATQKLDAGSFSLPSQELMTRALERWNALGLPPISVPNRVRSRLARS